MTIDEQYVISEIKAIKDMADSASCGLVPFEFMGRRITPRNMTAMISLRAQLLIRFISQERA